jgi:pimeloyl-ACP methyl ester carboxylesterase
MVNCEIHQNGNPELRCKEKTMHATSIVKNIVLVHGAFADGTSWSKIIPILEAEGYNIVAVQNPLTSLADDVAATKRIIALQDGPVILVGHS